MSLMGRGGDGTDGARVARVSVHLGAMQVDPPAVRAVAPPSRRIADSRGSLYVLLSPAGQPGLQPALTAELMTLIGETYYGLDGSITRGLRGALLAANEMLFERNVRADPSFRAIAGAVCAVVRQEDLYVAQMGPAVAITSRGMDTHRYPDHSAWITSEQPVGADLDREPPLGLRRDAEPSLFHATYRPEDLLILATATLVREASDGEVAAASLRTAHDDLSQALMDLSNRRDFAILLVRALRQTAASEPPAPIISTPSVRATPMANRAPAAPAIDEAAGFGKPASDDLPYRPFDAPATSGAARERVPDHPVARPGVAQPETVRQRDAQRQPIGPSTALSTADDTELSDDAYADSVYGSAPTKAAATDRRADDQADADAWEGEDVEIIRTPRTGINLGKVAGKVTDGARRLREGTENALLGVLPKEIPPRPLETDRPAISIGAKALMTVALIIPLIVLFTVVMTRIQYDRAKTLQHTNAVSQAQYLYDLAVRQEDAQLKRDDLYRAMTVIDQGLALTPDNTDLQDLKRRAQHQIDQVEGVEPIYAFAKLYFFEEGATSAADSSRIVVHGKDVMVLRRGSDRVYRFYLNDVGDALQPVEADPVIARRGDVIDGVTVSDIIDLNYMANEGSQSLARFIALDRSGNLLSYDANRGMRAQPVGNADLWLSPQAIGSFYGNLYVLDPLLGRLFKYLPSNNEYVKTPLDYFDAALGVDLTGAVDMAIDTNVYVLFADGTIKKYNNGQAVDFGMRGFYGTMRSPVAIYVSGGQTEGAVGYVYVADAGNSRVLQFSKDGDFIRQFRAMESEPYMNNLSGLYVDEAERRMFLVSGDHFVLCTLPALPQ
jgi:hypothetical protein